MAPQSAGELPASRSQPRRRAFPRELRGATPEGRPFSLARSRDSLAACLGAHRVAPRRGVAHVRSLRSLTDVSAQGWAWTWPLRRATWSATNLGRWADGHRRHRPSVPERRVLDADRRGMRPRRAVRTAHSAHHPGPLPLSVPHRPVRAQSAAVMPEPVSSCRVASNRTTVASLGWLGGSDSTARASSRRSAAPRSAHAWTSPGRSCRRP